MKVLGINISVLRNESMRHESMRYESMRYESTRNESMRNESMSMRYYTDLCLGEYYSEDRMRA